MHLADIGMSLQPFQVVVLPMAEETLETRRRVTGKSPAKGASKEVPGSFRAQPGLPSHIGELTAANSILTDGAMWCASRSHTEKYDYVYNQLRRGHLYETFQAAEDFRSKRKRA